MRRPSRRKFLQSSVAAPLAAALGGGGAFAFSPSALFAAERGQEQFENPQIIRYDPACYTVRDRDLIVHSGCFHYCRCPRELWHDRLVKFKQAGLNTVETYVFWNYHEPVEGRINLEEFEDFVKQVAGMGFYMIARPGPYVCAEWDAGGFPHWVIAKQFPLRSADPQSIETSRHWYNAVLPVIQRHTVTNGGPIILIQVENEYDYWGQVPSAEKTQYITALANMVWDAGIDIPIITNWCKEARNNANPVMARITDTADFYPRWDVVKQTLKPLADLRKAEPTAPLGVTELQGGWFSQFGGKLSVDQPGVNGAQLNLLTKTMLEQGVTFFSYYMGFGGTNFDWAGKNLTTTYDYAAPVREPGGLWEKYYAARGIGEFLNRLGPVLARAQKVDGAQSTNAAVSATERANGQQGFLFVRENANAQQQYKLTFPDPASPSHRLLSVPREGALEIGAREMKIFPLQIPIPGGQLRYSTAELLGWGVNEDRTFLLLCDEQRRAAEIALATSAEPKVEGDTAYQYWDSDFETVVLGVKLETTENMWLVNGNLQIIVVPPYRGLRTWIADFPPEVLPNSEAKDRIQVPFISTSALMAGSGSSRGHAWADFDYTPGVHHLTTLWSSQPDRCAINGSPSQAAYDEHWRTTRMTITVPPLPAQSQSLTQVETWTEKFDVNAGEWLTSQARPLELLGEIPYGYVKYHAEFQAEQASQMAFSAFSAFADDARQVFINGANVKEVSNNKPQANLDASAYLKSGGNTLDISYELFGSPNFGPKIAELKGMEFARVWNDPAKVADIGPWKIQLRPAAMHGRAIDPEFSSGGWTPATLGSAPPQAGLIPAYCWVRSKFTLEQPAEGWSIQWKASLQADRDALLYLNGRFVGRYVTEGPQSDFYLPEPWIQWGSSNVLTVVLAYTDQPQHIRSLSIAPYSEYATQRTRVEFHWT